MFLLSHLFFVFSYSFSSLSLLFFSYLFPFFPSFLLSFFPLVFFLPAGELGLRQFLESRGHELVVTADKDGDNCELDQHLKDAHYVISQPFYPAYITAERMANAPNLKAAITVSVHSYIYLFMDSFFFFFFFNKTRLILVTIKKFISSQSYIYYTFSCTLFFSLSFFIQKHRLVLDLIMLILLVHVQIKLTFQKLLSAIQFLVRDFILFVLLFVLLLFFYFLIHNNLLLFK